MLNQSLILSSQAFSTIETRIIGKNINDEISKT